MNEVKALNNLLEIIWGSETKPKAKPKNKSKVKKKSKKSGK
tara:strand:+ start:1609 stop:1731 length:123 start_codon:yes stop_codon:yes gene_type:complete